MIINQTYEDWLEETNDLLPDEIREEFEGSQTEEEWGRIKFNKGHTPYEASQEIRGMWGEPNT